MGFIGRVIGLQDVGICRIARDDSSCQKSLGFPRKSYDSMCRNRKKSQGVNGGQWSHQNCAFYIYIYSPMVEGVNWGAFFGKSTKSTRTIPEEKHWH